MSSWRKRWSLNLRVTPKLSAPSSEPTTPRPWCPQSPVGAERHDQVLLVVDQFEELFTLNPPDVQSLYSEILGRLALEHDVHVLISMRDDFLFHCQAYEPLRPVFSELTPLGPLMGGALRRALVQPASRCGYRFEDDDLVAEMLAEVEGERGALPLLAFAVSRLWEERDRGEGVLTREAYQRIGGVGGALGRHAEETLENIGDDRTPMVREIFRNLVTAQGTRAVRDLEVLLSIFDVTEKEAATDVLRALVDARLLTTFETHTGDEEPRRRIEIIHESLLANWPRLVRWRTQDQEGAQLRDELRQSARAWDDHGRHDDRLWTGTAYREFRLWRERYPGRLTELEEAFAAAMSAFANRRRRRRRFAVAASFIALLIILLFVGSFWRRSMQATARAEASELVALGQLELDNYPSATVAHAIASLELADGPAARRLALEALWKGPTAIIVNDEWTMQAQFTSDGRWLVQSRSTTATTPLRLISEDGSSWVTEHTEGGHASRREMGLESSVFGLLGWDKNRTYGTASVWSAPEGKKLVEAQYESGALMTFDVAIRSDQGRMITTYREDNGRVGVDALGFDGVHKRLGTVDLDLEVDGRWFVAMNRRGQWIAASTGHDVFVIDVGESGLSEPRLLGRQKAPVTTVDMLQGGQFVATADAECQIRLWDLEGTTPPIRIQGPPSRCILYAISEAEDYLVALSQKESGQNDQFWIWSVKDGYPKLLRQFDYGDYGGMWLTNGFWVRAGPDPRTRLWPLAAPADAEPSLLLRGEPAGWGYPRFHPNEKWLVVPDTSGLSLWPLARPYPAVIRRHEKRINHLEFGPAGAWLASSSNDQTVRVWPLEGEAPPPGRVLFEETTTLPWGLARSPNGRELMVGGPLTIRLLSLGNDPPVKIIEENPDEPGTYWNVAFNADGSLAATSSANLEPAQRKISVWNVASQEQIAEFAVGESMAFANPQFVDDDHLMALDNSGLRQWNIATGTSTLLVEGSFQRYDVSADRRHVVLLEAPTENDPGRAIFADLETGATTVLESHGRQIVAVALGSDGSFAATAGNDGVVRVGSVAGEEPHLLFAHEGRIEALAVDPKGRRIASGDNDGVIRIWPMPDLSKPPLHTLPREELIAKLKTLTNLRVVQDVDSPTGWNLTHDPFPGWETVPTW